MRNYSYLPLPLFFPGPASLSHPRLLHLLPLSGAEGWGVEAVLSPMQPLSAASAPHAALLLQPGAFLWAVGIQELLQCGSSAGGAVLEERAALVCVPRRPCAVTARNSAPASCSHALPQAAGGWSASLCSSPVPAGESSGVPAAPPPSSLSPPPPLLTLLLTGLSLTLFSLLPGSVFPFLTPLTAVELHCACGRAFGASCIWHLAAPASPRRGSCSPREQYHIPNAISRR